METGGSEAGVHPVYFNNSVAKGGILAGLLALCLVLGFFFHKRFPLSFKKILSDHSVQCCPSGLYLQSH